MNKQRIPQVAQLVQFFPTKDDNLLKHGSDAPIAAVITKVITDDMVNLTVIPHNSTELILRPSVYHSDSKSKGSTNTPYWDFIDEEYEQENRSARQR